MTAGIDSMGAGARPAAPEVPPIAPVAPVATLAYQSGLDLGRTGQSRWAVASWVLTIITVVFCLVCVIGMMRAKGWDALAWLVVGFYGNWVGCGLAAVCRLVGVVQRRRR